MNTARKVPFAPRGLNALAVAMLVMALPTPSRAELKDVYKPAYTEKVCVRDSRGAIIGPCHDVLHPAIPNAGFCSRALLAWSKGSVWHDDDVTVCTEFMGYNKFCADRGMSVGSREDPDGRLAIVCRPPYHHDTIDEQFVHIWTGIGEGLLTAAPFVAEGVLAGTCLFGQVYACAVLALQVSDQVGLKIPGEVGKAIYIANKAPQCIDGDVVACAYLGVQGASLVGLEIPGVPALKIWEDQQKCTDGEFAACVRLGKEAADAGGIEVGAVTASVIDAHACLEGNKDTCVALAKEAIREQVPLKGVLGAADDTAACDKGDARACYRLGKQISATALGLAVATPKFEPFGANTCTSSVIANSPAGLASAWNNQNMTTVSVFPSDGNQFGRPNHPSGRDGGWGDSVYWVAADFNGDGETDLAGVWNNGGHNTITVRQSSHTPQYTPVVWAPDVGTWFDNQVWLPGDFNGDGRMDIAQVWDEGGLATFVVYLSDGVRFATGVQWSRRDGGWGDEIKWAAGDFDGDGKTDIAAIWNNGGTNTITLRQSTGSSFALATWSANAGSWSDSSVWLPGDFNGDGHIDLARVWNNRGATSIVVNASDGSRFASGSHWSERDGGWSDDVKWTSGDFNGDGKTDVAAVWNNGGSNTLTVRQSTGSNFTPVHWRTNAEPWRNTAAWCSGQFPAPFAPSATELKKDHSALDGLFPADPTGASKAAESDESIRANTALAPPPPKALGRVERAEGVPNATTGKSFCEMAAAARAANRPTAAALQQRCDAELAAHSVPIDSEPPPPPRQ
ncbi:MAG: VCBS repeat-containing protein [Gammaproteobacteria bacterium]|nr:VCBS repeat-containing protein [Gammaproteobacteria bacterium]